ncbi:nucleolar protein 12-domain-containing protein [Lenzites betulinus]|nr:nucleolar protein 12-domain-containing protein [Lenzites betulinus]
MASSNISKLTKSHTIIAAKKKAKREQIKEVLFDDSARREFLTGFHKRKLQKKEDAKSKAIEREKQERLEARREHRRMLAQQAAKNNEEVERAYGGLVGADSDWDGVGSSKKASKGKGKFSEEQEEFEDEEQLATVTVIEDFDPDTLIHGEKPVPESAETADGASEPSATSSRNKTGRAPPRSKPRSDVSQTKTKIKTAGKAKDIKYQTASARKTERTKQRKRKVEKAERAGGKGSRRKGPSKGKR